MASPISRKIPLLRRLWPSIIKTSRKRPAMPIRNTREIRHVQRIRTGMETRFDCARSMIPWNKTSIHTGSRTSSRLGPICSVCIRALNTISSPRLWPGKTRAGAFSRRRPTTLPALSEPLQTPG